MNGISRIIRKPNTRDSKSVKCEKLYLLTNPTETVINDPFINCKMASC